MGMLVERLLPAIHAPEWLVTAYLRFAAFLQNCGRGIGRVIRLFVAAIKPFIEIPVGWFKAYMDWIEGVLYSIQLPEGLAGVWLICMLGGLILVLAANAVGLGFITKLINKKKNREGGFYWGFLLGVIGLVVVACRSAKKKVDTFDRSGDNPSPRPDALELMEADSEMWFCPGCGRAHPSAENACLCGVRKK